MLTNQNIDPTRDLSRKPFILWRPFITAWRWLVPASVAERDRQSPLARWLGVSVVVAISTSLLILAVIYARPLKNSYKNMRAESMVKEARQMAENGQMVNAVMKAQEAVQKAPDSIAAIRLNFEYFTFMRRDTALYFFDRLDELGALTPADEQLHVRCLLNLGRQADAAEALEKIMKSQPSSEALMKLAEDVWGTRGQDKALLNVLSAYSETHPEDDEGAFRLARVEVTSGNAVEAGRGMETLWRLADRDDALGLRALEFINGLPSHTPANLDRLIARLKSHPKGDDRHYVTALKHEVQRSPSRKKEIVMEATAKYRDKKRDELLPFIRWLVEEGEVLQVLAVLPEEDALKHRGLLENYLNALTILNRFDDVERILADRAVASILDPTTLSMFRAHLAYVLKKPAEELRSKLIAAKSSAQVNGRYPSLLRIAQYAEDRGHYDIAEDAYRLTIQAARRASAAPRIEKQAYTGLIKACEANRDTEALLAATSDASSRWPDDSSFLDRSLYVALLAGRNVELSLVQAQKLLQQQPKDNLRKLNVALAQFRLQDIQQAVSYLQFMDLNFLTEGQRAVFAGIAHRAGFIDEATGVVKAVSPQASMLPEESRFIQRVLNAK